MVELNISSGYGEMVDAQDLGSCGCKTVGVRVPLSTVNLFNYFYH